MIIDWLTFTISAKKFFDFYSSETPDLSANPHIKDLLSHFCERYLNARLDSEFRNGKNFYNTSINLLDDCGFVAFGGNDVTIKPDGTLIQREPRINFTVTGQGCSRISHFKNLMPLLESLGGKITRVDIALDDYQGVHNIEFAKTQYERGGYTSSGRPPKSQYIDDMGSGDGKTFYVGNRNYGKMLRVYEKGRQLGDKLSPWVRWEVEINCKDRDIPLRVLADPQAYFVGAYPVLQFVEYCAWVIKTNKEKARITYQRLRSVMVNQYGKLLNFAKIKLELSDHQIVTEFLNPSGIPKRLTAFKDESLSQSFAQCAT